MKSKNRGTSYARKLTRLGKEIEKKEEELEKKLNPFLKELRNNIIICLEGKQFQSFSANSLEVSYDNKTYLIKAKYKGGKKLFSYDMTTETFEIDFEELESLKTFNKYLEGNIWTTILEKEEYLKKLEQLEKEYSE